MHLPCYQQTQVGIYFGRSSTNFLTLKQLTFQVPVTSKWRLGSAWKRWENGNGNHSRILPAKTEQFSITGAVHPTNRKSIYLPSSISSWTFQHTQQTSTTLIWNRIRWNGPSHRRFVQWSTVSRDCGLIRIFPIAGPSVRTGEQIWSKICRYGRSMGSSKSWHEDSGRFEGTVLRSVERLE